MQGVAGGLRAEFAIVLQASIPERLATLMRKLDGDPDQHPGEVHDISHRGPRRQPGRQ